LFAGLILLNACYDGEEIDNGNPPELPPASSMDPDFSYFSGEEEESGRVSVVSSWLYAATNVTVYSSILSTALVVPVTAYKVALEQTPTFDEELGVWVWAYNANVGSAEYAVKLTAEVADSEIIWTGDISKDGVFENFVWFQGTSTIGGNSGSWTLYESYMNPTPWLSAAWEKSEVEGKANATFTVEKEGDNFGSSISYSATASGDFNRNVIITDTYADNTIT
ncbi:unnamed protein product, partial [Chrysoparadoxa australica]